MDNHEILHYIDQLKRVMNGDVWLDETFAGKLAHIDADRVFERPLPQVHSAAELISHLLEWRISVLSILRGGKRTLTVDSPQNWRTNEELAASGWQSLIAAFNKSQEEITDFLATQNDEFLATPAGKSRSMRYLVDGLLQHDLYHLGQLGLVIKLLLLK